MGQKLLFYLIYGTFKAIAILPMPALYLLSDALYLLIYLMAKYRRRVVRSNLRNAFPEKTDRELLGIERRFYHHLADYVVETIKLAHISQEELLRRAHFRNPEVIRSLLAQGHTCLLVVMGHYGNWEWFTGYSACFEGEVEVHQIYRPLTSRAFDRLFLTLRTRFHALGIKKNEAFREILRLQRSRKPGIVVFIADQTPSKANLHYWTTFLHQESAILTGPERIAVKLNLPVIYLDVRKVKRGYYTVEVELLTDRPQEMPEFRITEEYTRRMERTILRDPAYWLWTHKRWKHKRTENNDNSEQ